MSSENKSKIDSPAHSDVGRVFSVFDRSHRSNVVSRKKEFQLGLQTFLADDANIPVFPAVILKMDQMLRDPNTSLNDVEKVAMLDPGLASKLMKLANSAVYGGTGVRTLTQCFQRIGLSQLKKVLFLHGAASSFAAFKVKANWHHFWLHSILTARLTEKLYHCFAQSSGDEYLAGLMHDTGKLFLQKVYPDAFSECLDLMRSNKISSEQAEFAVFGFSHADVSADLCQRWKMHPAIVVATKYHHDPTYPDMTPLENCLTTCLGVADSLANSCDLNLIDKNTLSEQDIYRSPGWNRLRDYNQIRELVLDVVQEFAEVQTLAKEIVGTTG